MSAFEKLTKENISFEPIKLHLSIDSPMSKVEVFLIKGGNSVELKKNSSHIDGLYRE